MGSTLRSPDTTRHPAGSYKAAADQQYQPLIMRLFVADADVVRVEFGSRPVTARFSRASEIRHILYRGQVVG